MQSLHITVYSFKWLWPINNKNICKLCYSTGAETVALPKGQEGSKNMTVAQQDSQSYLKTCGLQSRGQSVEGFRTESWARASLASQSLLNVTKRQNQRVEI